MNLENLKKEADILKDKIDKNIATRQHLNKYNQILLRIKKAQNKLQNEQEQKFSEINTEEKEAKKEEDDTSKPPSSPLRGIQFRDTEANSLTKIVESFKRTRRQAEVNKINSKITVALKQKTYVSINLERELSSLITVNTRVNISEVLALLIAEYIEDKSQDDIELLMRNDSKKDVRKHCDKLPTKIFLQPINYILLAKKVHLHKAEVVELLYHTIEYYFPFIPSENTNIMKEFYVDKIFINKNKINKQTLEKKLRESQLNYIGIQEKPDKFIIRSISKFSKSKADKFIEENNLQ